MDYLIAFLSTIEIENISRDKNECREMFSLIYDIEFYVAPIQDWLKTKFKTKMKKNEDLSTRYRIEADECYKKGKYIPDCLEMYTKSLCWAIPKSEAYGDTLKERSELFITLDKIQDALKDINHHLTITDWPIDITIEILIRKAKCYIKMGDNANYSKCIAEIRECVSSEDFLTKVNFTEILGQLENCNIETQRGASDIDFYELPPYDTEENYCFANASSKLKLSYNEDRGRHVVARKPIKENDVLFIEKAFVFAPIFNDHKNFQGLKCYYCLKDTLSSIPCDNCTLCVYCNETCKLSSWDESHRWECEGMRADIWYDLGIGFLAFRAMLKGVKCGLREIGDLHNLNVNHFGDKNENYPYFNGLLWHRDENTSAYVGIANIIVKYLECYTGFFHWLKEQQQFDFIDHYSLVKLVGANILRHIMQLSNNGSIIEHWSYPSDKMFTETVITVASGVFPSVSMMNHSCKPNVTNYFVGDTIVVKALEDIPLNSEIFNCYGVDYRYMTRDIRQKTCQTLYNFECKCTICEDLKADVYAVPNFLCTTCSGPIPDIPAEICYCCDCRQIFELKNFRTLHELSKDLIKSLDNKPDLNTTLEVIIISLRIKQKILFRNHKDFEDIYDRLYNLYTDLGQHQNMLKYYKLWLKNCRSRLGENCREVGIRMYETALAVLHCLSVKPFKEDMSGTLKILEEMLIEAEMILSLYYPPYYIKTRLCKQTAFFKQKM